MKFYNREHELEMLRRAEELSVSESQMTVLTGRRRIGKTKLMLRFTEGKTAVYLFVSRKSENILCQQFAEVASAALDTPIGQYSRFADLFEHLLRISAQRPFTLIIDEFQEFENIDGSIIGDIQRVWDLNKDRSRVNLLLSGSVYSMMHRIFEDEKQPLFSRASNIIRLQPFRTDVLKQILRDNNPDYTAEDLLALYSFTGGVAWYIELLMKAGATTFEKMTDYIFSENSFFIGEGKNLLVEEFGRDYNIYFSILECVARGVNTRGELETAVGKSELGGYLAKLTGDYGLISQSKPIFSKPSAKVTRYSITDNLLTFWFRFIYKYMNYIEAGGIQLLKQVFLRDYTTFSGQMLERYFRQQARESGKYTAIGNFWDRRGEHETDIILVNDLDKVIVVGEIKRQAKNIDLVKLSDNAEYFLNLHSELKPYKLELQELDLQKM
jgi:hypothetical protein